jgi:hypothetical protein
MSPQVITSYRKDRAYPPGHGYGRRTAPKTWVGQRASPASAVVLHSTNGNKGSSLAAEAKFLRDSELVSCHDLIGKGGEIIQILPPDFVAWHAGVCKSGYDGMVSIGIELHHAVGDDYPQAQMDALWHRTNEYISMYNLLEAKIETHRFIALPAGRKQDPSDWSDADFYAWRDRLYTSTLPPGTFPVDPRLQSYWEKTGGLWASDHFCLGYALTPLTNNVQRFERAALRINPDGSIDGLLLSEAVELL